MFLVVLALLKFHCSHEKPVPAASLCVILEGDARATHSQRGIEVMLLDREFGDPVIISIEP